MLTAPAVLHGDRARLLGFDPAEHPVALQLGGAEPRELAAGGARRRGSLGYDEINLNVGCPSDRVQSGRFGACLMREPALVADCIAAMRAAVSIPVTVKCRLGVDEQDEYADLERFVETVRATGCNVFVVHARKAWLEGLSPKENRDIPPLNYARVYRLKREFPELTIVINGGIASVADVHEHLAARRWRHARARRVSRAVSARGDRARDFRDAVARSRRRCWRSLRPYVEAHLARGDRLQHISRHILGLYQGLPRRARVSGACSANARIMPTRATK